LQSKLTCLWKDPSAPKQYRTAVSLHSHTSHSKENLSFIADYASRQPLLNWALSSYAHRAYTRGAIIVDFKKAFWRPPLLPLAAFRVERNQIEQKLNMSAMVSITDHDTIEAPLNLRVVPESGASPISVEWTVPYKDAILHIGVHNLSSSGAQAAMARLAEYTEYPAIDRLREILKSLHDDPEVLVVLNHPLWDLAHIGKARHNCTVHDFIADLGMYVHAFEISGVRRWAENREVLELAEKWNQLVVSGGDRHGTEPNAVLNVTNARSFPEFVDEIRRKRQSHVLLMPQYAHSFTLRIFQSLLDAVREYPDLAEGSRIWDQRVFHPDNKGEVKSLADMWTKPPIFVTGFFQAVGLLDVPSVRNALRAALAKPENENLFTDRTEEAKLPWTESHASRISRTPTRKSTAWPTLAANLKGSRENEGSPS